MEEDVILTTNPEGAADPVEASTPTSDEASAMDSLIVSMERMADGFQALQRRVQQLEPAAPAPANDPAVLPGNEGTSDTLGDRLAKIEARFEQRAADLDHIAQGIRRRSSLPGAEDVMRATDPDRRFNICRAVRGHLTQWQDWDPDHPEKTIVNEYARRMAIISRETQSTFLAPLGGFLVPPEVQTEYIETLQAQTVSIEMGARVIPLVGSPATWPTGRGGAVAYWTPELASPTKSDVRFGQLQLTPKPLTCFVDVGDDLIFQTSGQATQIVNEEMGFAMAQKLDLGILKGTHASGEPLGIVNQPGINTSDWHDLDGGATDVVYTGAGQTVSKALDHMLFQIINRNAYGNGETVGWVMGPLLAQKLRAVNDADGRPLFFSALNAEAGTRRPGLARGMFWDHPFMTTTLLTSGTVDDDLILGKWNQVLVGNWGAMEVAASRENSTNFELGQVTLKLRQKVDAGLRHIEAFEIGDNVDGVIYGP